MQQSPHLADEALAEHRAAKTRPLDPASYDSSKPSRDKAGSPLDVEGFSLDLTADEIVAFVHEGRCQ